MDSSFKPVHLTTKQTPSGEEKEKGKRVLSFFTRTEKSQKEQNQEWKVAGERQVSDTDLGYFGNGILSPLLPLPFRRRRLAIILGVSNRT